MEGLRSRRFFGAFSFVFIYCWYNAYWRSFSKGPIAESLGSLAGPAEMFVSAGVITGVIVALVLPWPRLVEKNTSLKILVHLFAFFPFFLFPFFHAIVPIALLGLSGGFCIGAVMVRAIYTMFFEVMDIHPAKITVIGYLIIQTYIHLSDIIPLVSVPPLYYALTAVTLLVGVVLSYLKRNEEEMERRRVLPENSFRLSNTWQLLALIALLQVCLTLYGDVLLPQTTLQWPRDEMLNIIPDVVMFLFLGFFGKKLSIMGTLTAFLALYGCSLGAFFIFGMDGRVPMQLFMEPAYRLVDLIFIWTMITVFFTYGKNQTRLKICLAVFFVVRFGVLACVSVLASVFPPTSAVAYIALIPVFLAALILPSAQRELKSMEAQRAYAEKFQSVDVPLPSKREDVLEARDSLLQTLPQGTSLSAEEQEALCYLIDGQETEVTAYFMGITIRRVKDLDASVLKTLQVESTNELMIKLGEARVEKNSRERQAELFSRFNLTAREQEVATLLLSGMPVKSIPQAMGVSLGTVNFHSQNLYRKLGIQSRAELSNLIFEMPAKPAETK